MVEAPTKPPITTARLNEASSHLSPSAAFVELSITDKMKLIAWLITMEEEAKKEKEEAKRQEALEQARAAALAIAEEVKAVRSLQEDWKKDSHKYSKATRDSVDGYFEYMAQPGHAVSSITISSRPVDKKALMAWAEAQEEYRAKHGNAEVKLASPFKGQALVTSGFGHRCGSGCGEMHAGVDMIPQAGGSRDLFAPADGIILASGFNNGGFGNMVLIGLNDGRQVLMAHMADGHRMPSVGTHIKKGEHVGVMGATGEVRSSRGGDPSHLHMEVRVGNQAVPPMILGSNLNKGNVVPGQETTATASVPTPVEPAATTAASAEPLPKGLVALPPATNVATNSPPPATPPGSAAIAQAAKLAASSVSV